METLSDKIDVRCEGMKQKDFYEAYDVKQFIKDLKEKFPSSIVLDGEKIETSFEAINIIQAIDNLAGEKLI